MSIALSLDTPTLLIVTALVVAFSGALLLLTQGIPPQARFGRSWAVSMLVGSAGLLASAAAQVNPHIPSGIGTAFLLLATSLAWTGARTFSGRPGRAWVGWLSFVAWLATSPLQSESDPWLGTACFVGAGFTFGCALELWRARAERLASRPAAIIVLLVHVGFYAGRGATALFGELGEGWPPVVMTAMLLEALLHTIAIAFLLTAMIKERVELRTSEQLRAIALSDALTGVGNRRHFDQQLEVELRRARRSGSTLALLMIDVDHFKRLNDTLGHLHGDFCLREVAQAITRLVQRPGDLAARYGGEEFAVLLTDTTLAAAARIADVIRCAVHSLTINNPGCGHLTVSIGVASTRSGGSHASASLIREADLALYQAKRTGRNRVVSMAGVAVPGPALAA